MNVKTAEEQSADPIEILCEGLPDVESEYIRKVIPAQPTKVVEARVSSEQLDVTLYTNCSTAEEARAWVRRFEELTRTTYTIRSTNQNTGRYVVFKQSLHCQHNTRMKAVADWAQSKVFTKNTNCPARLIITIHAVKKRYQGKHLGVFQLRKQLPCEINARLSHNHDTETPEALRFRKVGEDVRRRLLELYRVGHSPMSALETLRVEICSTYENPEAVLADRRYSPDYMYCYHLYTKEFAGQYGTLKQRLRLKKRIEGALSHQDVEQVITEDTSSPISILTTDGDGFSLEQPEITTEDSSPAEENCVEYYIHTDESHDLGRGMEAIEALTAIFTSFLEKSPGNVAYGIEEMAEKAQRLTDASEFLAACSNFGLDSEEPHHRCNILTYPQKTKRRKPNQSAAVLQGDEEPNEEDKEDIEEYVKIKAALSTSSSSK